MDLTEALGAVTSTSQKAQAGYNAQAASAQEINSEADTVLQNAKEQQQNLVDGVQALGVVKQQDAQAVVNSEARDTAINSFLAGNKALAPDSSVAVKNFEDAAASYNENKGGFLNQLALGMTGRDIQLEKLQRSAQALKTITDVVGDLAQKASASDLLTKQLQATASAPQMTAAQNKVDQATTYLEHVVPAEDRTLKLKATTAGEVAAAGAGAANEAKNLFSTLIQFRNANTAEVNQVAQTKLLNLTLEEKTREVANAKEDDSYMDSLSAQLGLPKPALKAQGNEVLAALSSIAAGVPVVSNLGDSKQVELAARTSKALPDPYQQVTAPYVGNQILAYQQGLAQIQQGALVGGKTVQQTAKNANFNIINNVQKDFLDTVPINIPGESQAAPLVNILGNWFLNPVGSKGGVFWDSPQVKSYIASGSPGSSVAQRIFNDKNVSPGILKNGININYLQATGATPAQAMDFYNFIRHQVILSTPYSIYNLAPPQANIPLNSETINQGFLGSMNAQVKQIYPTTEADIERAYVELNAAKKAAEFAAKNNTMLTPSGAGN